ncbi:catalytic domain-containing protein of components of various dehydrogenase complexes [Caldalkalibacillus thermarum TA2.A1]|uniref:Dihydrolipoamide acetyltransferase component of pyruvate dehydrogenase complex n=1 Tax=Caldalkalibacillus thermarum (strain TA2.A1) TaxID=986075 RepID=F5L5S7_CALTT|nr:dihydrolipoamide acetyltransferase family protein [Caldalkalibacillus thermarum]EGL83319.1 catalytic domain-containing protein of components of various dehydrogenase complexes [Caldalkalibacillus thermarum TA2.A1]QZT34087.1 2-oxo acid dehydrogenase subunit E2 [Caldalkalibacillus thermarum TA2.A1]
MLFEFKLPDVGEGITEGEIVRWRVSEGEMVKEDQVLAEVQTDKAVVELPSPVAGKVKRLLAEEGDVVAVGTVLVTIDCGQSATKQLETEPLPQREGKTEVSNGEHRPSSREPAGPAPERKVEQLTENQLRSGVPLAVPSVRRLARELKVDLREVAGTGKHGRITEEDVRRYAQAREQLAARQKQASVQVHKPGQQPVQVMRTTEAAATAEAVAERMALRGIRREMARNMKRAVVTIAHCTGFDEADATGLIRMRESMQEAAAEKGLRLTYLPFITKAVLFALKKHPLFNATFNEERDEILFNREINIGIAVDTPQGLMVPVIAQAGRKSIIELARDIQRLSEKAREQKLTLQELQGGTFTISNIGSIGGMWATPLIQPPQVAILGVHKIYKKPVVKEDPLEGDQVVIRQVIGLSLSFDHRIIDGAQSARFMQDVIRYIENPHLMLLEAR